MSEIRPILKPHQIEGIVTLTPAEKAQKRRELYHDQGGVCACGCNRMMVMELDRMDTATLDHKVINKMGCKKQDASWNLRLLRWDCNMKKGSKRDV